MKILMTTDNIGGVWTFATDLARGLTKCGVEVILAVIGDPLTDAQKKELDGITYRHFNARQEWMDNPWENVYASGQWLMWLKELENPDIMHLNSYTLGCLDWQVPVVITLHSCVLSWWEAVRDEQAPDSWSTYHNHVKAGIHSADVVTAPSSFMLEAAEKHYGSLKNKKLIYNGRSNLMFSNNPKVKMVFSMGRLWDEAKNIRLLIKAAEKINFPVYIAGDLEEKDYQKIPLNVTFLGRLSPPEIAGWLSKSGVYALPVKYEPFGYSFLEAAFSGCALVGTDIPSLNEIWGNAMVYSRTDDAGRLAADINNLLTDDKFLNKMGQRAYKRALKLYMAERMIKDYLKLYKSLKIIKSKLVHH